MNINANNNGRPKKKHKTNPNITEIKTKVNSLFFPTPFYYSPMKYDTRTWFDYTSNSFLFMHNQHNRVDPQFVRNNFLFEQSYHKPNTANFIEKLQPSQYISSNIQFFPTAMQINILNNWFESYRVMKNFTIKHFNQLVFNKANIDPSFIRTRNLLLHHKVSIIQHNQGSPHTIFPHSIDYAIKEVCANFKGNLKLHRGNVNKFRVRYCKQSNKNKTVKIEKRELKHYDYAAYMNVIDRNMYTDFLVNNDNKILCNRLGVLHCISKVPPITSDCTIFTKNGRYFIGIPREMNNVPKVSHVKHVSTLSTLLKDYDYKSKKCINIDDKNNIKTIGIDLGIRTFLTGYSNNGTIEIGSNIKDTFLPILKKIDKMEAIIRDNAYTTKREKRGLKIGIRKRRMKIRNLVKELHNKTINKLVENYDNIIVGNISTKSIISSRKRENQLSKVNKRLISSLSLYKFKEKLRHKSNLYGKICGEINEAYTSKLCSNCGNMKQEKNTTKIYKCNRCKVNLDRDLNAAKNIYILGTTY